MQISVDVLVRQTRSASELNLDLAASAGSIIEPLVTLCIAAVARARTQGVQGIVLATIGRRLA